MNDKTVGSRAVNDTALKLGVNKSRVTQLTCLVFRKMRWPNSMKKIEDFIDEYNKKLTES